MNKKGFSTAKPRYLSEMSISLNKGVRSLFAVFRGAVIVALVVVGSPAKSFLQTTPPRLVAPPPPRHYRLPLDFVVPQPIAKTPVVESSENVLAAPSVTSGTWTALANSHSASFWPSGAFLLTDGRVLVQDADLTNVAWWTLTLARSVLVDGIPLLKAAFTT